MATIHRSQPGTSGTTKLNHQTNEAWLPVPQRQLNIAPPLDPAACYGGGVLCSNLVLLLGNVEMVLKRITVSGFFGSCLKQKVLILCNSINNQLDATRTIY